MRTSYVGFQAAPDLLVAGKLATPVDARAVPAVLICHGSDGVDGRGDFHALGLHDAGIATLEIDMWAARGTRRGASARPRSPLETLTDAFAALRFLRKQPEINPDRIGVMGFSWGGVVTLLSAVRANAEPRLGAEAGFAAHAAFYPVCWTYDRAPGFDLTGLTGAPILIQTGSADAYDTPDAGDVLVDRLQAQGDARVRGVTHIGATHGFDRDLPAQTITDPAAHLGRGGEVVMEFHPSAAKAARAEAVQFFSEELAGG